MKEDEFWVDALAIEGHTATVRACFNEFAVTISVERRDGEPISAMDAERAYTEVLALVTRRIRFERAGGNGPQE